jgi:hypothetical protein
VMTVWKVLRREGIHQSGQATMEEFQGTASHIGISEGHTIGKEFHL